MRLHQKIKRLLPYCRNNLICGCPITKFYCIICVMQLVYQVTKIARQTVMLPHNEPYTQGQELADKCVLI